MTYKQAIRLCTQILKEHGLDISNTAQKQLGYLVHLATEGEISKNLHHDFKDRVRMIAADAEWPSIDDEGFLSSFRSYAQKLGEENPEGGEINLGWLFLEARDVELWQVLGIRVHQR